ncbi:hypothetical protein QQG55_18480 [Brugia pahangi]
MAQIVWFSLLLCIFCVSAQSDDSSGQNSRDQQNESGNQELEEDDIPDDFEWLLFGYKKPMQSSTVKAPSIKDQKKYECGFPGCDASTWDRKKYLRHISKHNQPGLYRCNWPRCKSEYRCLSALRQHYQKHQSKFACKKCGASFFYRSLLKRHTDHCSKGCNTTSNINLKSLSATTSMQFKNLLKRHMDNHKTRRRMENLQFGHALVNTQEEDVSSQSYNILDDFNLALFDSGSTEEHLQLKHSSSNTEKENAPNQSYYILDDFNLALFDSGSTEEDLQLKHSSSNTEKENAPSQSYYILDDFNLALFDSGKCFIKLLFLLS